MHDPTYLNTTQAIHLRPNPSKYDPAYLYMIQPFHARLNISKHDPTDQCTTNLSIHDPTYLSTTQPIHARPSLSKHDPTHQNMNQPIHKQPNLSIHNQPIYARPNLSKYHLTHLSTTQPIPYMIHLSMHDPVYLNTTQPIYTWPNLSINDPTYPSNILSIHSPNPPSRHNTTQFNATQRSTQYNTIQLQSFQRKRKRASSVYIRAYVNFMVQTLNKRTLPHRVRLLQSVHFSMTHYSLYLFCFPPAALKHSRPWYWVLTDVSETKCLHGQSSGVVTLRSPLPAGEVQSVLAPFHGRPEVKMLLQQKQRVSWLVVGEHI